jgi:hypothetical protein
MNATVRAGLALARVRTITALPYRVWQASLLDALSPPDPGAVGMPDPVVLQGFRIAARNHPGRPSCLRRAMALNALLRTRGCPARVIIGVARGADGIDAHAWVEVRGAVIEDAPDVARRFTPISASPQGTLTPQFARSIVTSP